ncbi:MAG: CoA transferase, partial [bacterium]|nr:CoA transferase [bacterium]
DRFDAAAELQAAGVAAAGVAKPVDRVDNDPNTAAWGLWPTVVHGEMGRLRVDGIPAHFSETDWVLERGAPLLGQHNRQVLGGLLGYSDAELADWAAEGVI